MLALATNSAEGAMAMTPAERTAVRFLVAVAVLGSGVQVAAQWRHRGAADAGAVEALHRQRAAVDSARLASRGGTGARERAGAPVRRARAGVRTLRVPSAEPLPAQGPSVSYGAAGAPAMSMWPAEAGGAPAAALPSRRRGARSEATGAAGAGGAVVGPVDVDRATAAELERLPKVGPALAARIVADREARGAFGSLEGLSRVRGIGPGLVRLLGPHVTFSAGGRRWGG